MACAHGWLFAIPCPRCAAENAKREAAALEVTAPVTKSKDPPSRPGGRTTSPKLKPKCAGCRPFPVDLGDDDLAIPSFLLRAPDGSFLFHSSRRPASDQLINERPSAALAKATELADLAAKQRALLDEKRRIADLNKANRNKTVTEALTGKAAWRKIMGDD